MNNYKLLSGENTDSQLLLQLIELDKMIYP